MEVENDIDEFIPLNYCDSDNELGFSILDDNNYVLYEKIVQKANSIGGIRKLNYIFKRHRRDLFSKSQTLDDNYLNLCQDYLNKLSTLEEDNLTYICNKLGLSKDKSFKKLAKIDRDYF